MMRSSRHAGVGLTPFHHAADYGRHGGEGHLDTTRDAGGLQVELRFRLGKSQARPTGQHLGGRATLCYPNQEATCPASMGCGPRTGGRVPPRPPRRRRSAGVRRPRNRPSSTGFRLRPQRPVAPSSTQRRDRQRACRRDLDEPGWGGAGRRRRNGARRPPFSFLGQRGRRSRIVRAAH
jgi:hypothetical protein